MAKPPKKLIEEITPEKIHAEHMCLGLATETGELADAVKVHAIYNRPVDLENVVEEAGDLLFYLQGLLSLHGKTLKDAMLHNQVKLKDRYVAGQYTDFHALARLDKQETDDLIHSYEN